MSEHWVILLQENIYRTIENRSIGLNRISRRGKRKVYGQSNGVVTRSPEGFYENAVAQTIPAIECASEAGDDVYYFPEDKGIISFIF